MKNQPITASTKQQSKPTIKRRNIPQNNSKSNASPTTTQHNQPPKLCLNMSATFQLNINGINEACQQYKIKAIEEMIHSSNQYIPYFVITESHLKTRNRDIEIAIKDYSTLRSDRPIIYKGGAVIYTHNNFVVDDHDTYADKICQSVMVYNSTNNLILVAVYRPPGADATSFQSCMMKLEDFISKHSDADIHLYGDFNMRFVD